MSTKEAIKILRQHGYDVEKINKHSFLVDKEPYTARELCDYATYYTSENNRNTVFKKQLKYWEHKNNRHATKQALNNMDFDSIPQNKKVKGEDPWNWD